MISRLLTTSALVSVLAAAPAWAQSVPPGEVSTEVATQSTEGDTTGTQREAPVDDILVTGSRIPRPNLESAVPIQVVSGEELYETSKISVGDILNELPQLRDTYSQQNSTRFLGTRGLNLLDLRGLGTQRTLVLVNGRRHVAGDILVNGVSPDVNTFPTDLIERVDVVTGGNSSIYGSDAIAGVVNFILKEDFDGFQVRGQSGLNLDYNDAGTQYVSVLAGKNFDDGRGNISANVEYAHSSPFYASGRGRNLSQNNNFVVIDSDPASATNGSDGIPDRLFFNDIRSSTISLGGQALVYQGTNPRCGVGPNASAYACSLLFQPDGSLIPQTGNRIGLAPTGNFIGGNGTSSREGELLTLSPDLERISVNVIAHYEFSDALEPFFEGKYVRTRAFGSQSGPFFSQGTTTGDPGNRERVRLDNPYLTAQARTFLTDYLAATTVNANTGAALTAAQLTAQRTAIANGSFRFGIRRNWVDFGIRDEEITRETFRLVGGLRGTFNDDWRYEVSANYGEHNEQNLIAGNVDVQRYLLGLDVVRDAAGNFRCASQIDPTRRIAYVDDADGIAGKLASDIAACVPIDPFGEGSIDQTVRNYVLASSRATGKISQFVVNGFVGGDSSQLFELPGGPVGFSIGAEYRRETNAYDLDDLTQAGYAFYNAIPAFSAPSFETKEVFGELSVPILKDTPFFEELTLSGSVRYADYKGAVGGVFAYSGNVVWAPVRDLRFRGNYSRSVRAPNLSELYSTPSQNFAPGFVDPCSERNIATGSSFRAANCAAAGRPAGYDFVYASSLEIISAGNVDLNEETSDSYTLGAIIEPRWVPGFSISVDWYDITVNDVISSVSAQFIANQCYDLPDLNNSFCALFQRAGAAGGPRGEVPFQILEGNLQQLAQNFAKFRTRGLDTQVGYRRDFGEFAVNVNAIWTHTFRRDNFTDPTNPDFRNRLLDELADPSDQVNVNASMNAGPITIGYQLRWLDEQYLNTYEDFNTINGLPPQNQDYADRQKYPDVFYHDVRVDFKLDDKFNIYAGVDNVTDRQPPLGLTGVGAGSGIYDVRGRIGYVGFRGRF